MKSLIFIMFILLCNISLAQDKRYCGFVNRDNKGNIIRSTTVIKQFQLLYPCPSTGLSSGPCPKWSKDHILPLACGGCDSIENMQWLPNKIKTCTDDNCKDRFERLIYKTSFCK